jgi:hypothetical protein
MLKYSRNTLPKEILLGQAEESYTGEKNAPNLNRNDGLSKEIEKSR